MLKVGNCWNKLNFFPENLYILNKLFPFTSRVHLKNSTEKCWKAVEKVRSMSKYAEKFFYLKKKLFSLFWSHGHAELKFDNIAGIFERKVKIVLLNVRNREMKSRIITKRIFFFKMVLWRRRFQFFQPCPKVFTKKPKNFRSSSEKDRKLKFFKKKHLSPKMFLWAPSMQF